MGWNIQEVSKPDRELLQVLYDLRLLRWKRNFLERGLRIRGQCIIIATTIIFDPVLIKRELCFSLRVSDLQQMDELDLCALGINDKWAVRRLLSYVGNPNQQSKVRLDTKPAKEMSFAPAKARVRIYNDKRFRRLKSRADGFLIGFFFSFFASCARHFSQRVGPAVVTGVCLTCQSTKATFVCRPCDHACLCEDCCANFSTGTCPRCRAAVLQTLPI